MNFQAIAAQAQKMQKEIQKKQEEFFKKEFEVDYKTGAVIVTIMGDSTIKKIKINPALVDPDDVITLEEMVAEAINEASSLVKQELDKITSSMMPSGMGGLGGLF